MMETTKKRNNIKLSTMLILIGVMLIILSVVTTIATAQETVNNGGAIDYETAMLMQMQQQTIFTITTIMLLCFAVGLLSGFLMGRWSKLEKPERKKIPQTEKE